jgi:hypothetical protein
VFSHTSHEDRLQNGMVKKCQPYRAHLARVVFCHHATATPRRSLAASRPVAAAAAAAARGFRGSEEQQGEKARNHEEVQGPEGRVGRARSVAKHIYQRKNEMSVFSAWRERAHPQKDKEK